MALAEGKRGPFPIGKGAQNFAAMGDFSELYVTECLPRYYPATYNGWMFHFTTSYTLTSASLTPLAASTGIPIIALWNPPNSGKNAVITKVGCSINSGTIVAGGLVWNYSTFAVLTTATQSTPVSGIVGQAAANIAKVFSGVVTTGALVGIFYKQAVNLGVAGAINTGTPVSPQHYEDVGGDIVIPPGAWAGLASNATSTEVVNASVSWIELPI